MSKKQKVNEQYTEYKYHDEKLIFYKNKLFRSIRLIELLRKLLVVYNKLYEKGQKTIRLSSLLCGISGKCLYKLGRCPGIHGVEYLEDLNTLLLFLKENIVLTRIVESDVNGANLSKITLDNGINENNIANYTFKFINERKLSKIDIDKIIESFKNIINGTINEKEENKKFKELNITEKSYEDVIIKRINELINVMKVNEGEMNVENILEVITKSIILKGGIINKKYEEPKETIYCTEEDKIYSIIKPEIMEMLDKYMSSIGIEKFKFYCHQSEAIKGILDEDMNVMITTSTCSGKSMCYIIPSLQYILTDIDHLTLFIFPTKALSEDQLNKINSILSCMRVKDRQVLVNKLDGDTNVSERKEILSNSNLILTNIDFIHWNIELISKYVYNRLRLIVIDEAHVYTGNFGLNASYILRRLKRGIHYYREKNELLKYNNNNEVIKYIVCTATILNPHEHFKNITGIDIGDVKLVDKDTSYKSESTTIIWDTNKNSNNNDMMKKYKSYNECINIILELYYLKRRLIVFCSSRKAVENIKRELTITLRRLKMESNQLGLDYENDIQIYRGGISKTERKKLENLIFSRGVRIVVCTVALELGIDVKYFDTVLVYGYPGSINRLVQQFGRCGREKTIKSLKILLLNENNELDNYISCHSDQLLNRKYDSCVINLRNPYLLILHLICLMVESYKNINISRDLEIMKMSDNNDYNYYVGELMLFLYNRNVVTCVTNDMCIIHKELENAYWYYNWNRIKNKTMNEDASKTNNNYMSLLNLYFDGTLENNQLILSDVKDAYRNLDIRDSDTTILIYSYEDQTNPIDSIPISNCIRFIYPESIYSINGVLYNTKSIDLNLRKGECIIKHNFFVPSHFYCSGLLVKIGNGDKRLKQKTVSSGEVSVLMQGNGEKYQIQNEKLLDMSVYITGAKVTYDIYSYTIYEYVNGDWLFTEEKYIQNPLIYSFSTFGMKIQLKLKKKFELEYLNIGIHGIIHNIINSLPKYIYCNINDISCECPDINTI
ncbi:Lhr1/Ski2 family RNA SFII helicase [Cryptosporidium ryanae]|uniref:Lhr1/Ski2 family RNA SFII helicase n=1 Tax=Cryptosporidium ryanae TaxID=515981 RepID=UPI00351A6C30|nr:Lhr1/Ski2 family RNA SFII helicase [Cryptosporidium ryanae]